MKSILAELQNELEQYHDDSVLDNKSRFIVHDEKYIYLYLKESGALEKASYTPELYHFMARPSCCSYSFDYKKERVQVELMSHQKAGKRYKPTLGASLVQSPSTLVSSFAGNNPMVGMTVSVAVAVEESCK